MHNWLTSHTVFKYEYIIMAQERSIRLSTLNIVGGSIEQCTNMKLAMTAI